MTMQLTSAAFEDGAQIPTQYTCDGSNVSPPLTIQNVPAQAISLALVVDDIDVPKNLRPDGVWDHWVVFNIPVTTTEIPGGVQPEGVAGVGTRGLTVYSGPCPPDGKHRYFFKLYALDVLLELPAGATKQEVERTMDSHIIEQTELMGTYTRQTITASENQ